MLALPPCTPPADAACMVSTCIVKVDMTRLGVNKFLRKQKENLSIGGKDETSECL